MSSKTDALPFRIGTTLYGGRAAELAADIANGTLKGEEVLGRVWEIDDVDFSSTATVKPQRTNVLRKVMAVRNTSGAVMHRTRLVTMSGVAGAASTKNVIGYSTLVNQASGYPIDEHLSAANGCPASDICWVVIEGPALCSMPASQVADVAAGDIIGAMTGSTTGATTSGRVFVINTAATTNTGDALLNRVGRAMSAKSSSLVAADLLVNILHH